MTTFPQFTATRKFDIGASVPNAIAKAREMLVGSKLVPAATMDEAVTKALELAGESVS